MTGPIAVFDSGLGGLTVVREILLRLPRAPLVYVGDQARSPYGSRSREEIRMFSLEILGFLLRFRPALVVAACNTVSSVALDLLRRQADVPVLGMVEPGARLAARAGAEEIAVLATPVTVASGVYPRLLYHLRPELSVFSKSCPTWVPLLEGGAPPERLRRAVCEELGSVRILWNGSGANGRRRLRAVLLGCTHYPLLAPYIRECLGEEVTLLNPAEEVAEEVARMYPSSLKGEVLFYTTGDPDFFSRWAGAVLARPVHVVHLPLSVLQGSEDAPLPGFGG
ncbi:glutamate racemase [Brockia lithotrophica]|uniref:Glutamate racemase n=1 Tax=Brockia lithotrophica TaxID=933949 RepID=A0A660KVX8_9BACL|nr:glutamate racemase [Brockia lithotrophica]RKQ84585.1 glutamate racemase [Brockia lithotrophica]